MRWNGKELQLLDERKDNDVAIAQRILGSYYKLFLTEMRPMSSVGGSVSAEKEKDGSSEISAEAHVTTKSDDGDTSITASGEATIDNQGNYSGKIEVRIEHEF